MSHISLVTLGVDDLDRATDFYEALGWRRSSASVEGTVTFFHAAPVVLALFGRDDLAGDAHLSLSRSDGSASVALAMNVESQDQVDRVLASAQAAGGTISKRAQRAEWGGYSGYFLDPEGHLWEVAHNPYFDLLPDGRVVLPDSG
ncbi:MAG: VOC family protein [Egibacteraceae bacterium]